MLLEFKVSNYRSIGEEQILSLIPSKKKGEDNIIVSKKYMALNAIAIYGSNASGKSNLLLSMSLLDKIVNLSARSSSTTKLPYDPFLLRKGWANKPTKFEVTFVINEIKYRYGLEFLRDKIVSEWLYRKVSGREVYLFMRKEDVIDVSSGLNGNSKIIDTAIEATRPNALFLSTCDMFNIEEAKTIFQWFRNFQMIDGLNNETTEVFGTVELWADESYQGKINEYMKKLGLGLVKIDIKTKDFDSSELPENLDEVEKDKLAKFLKGSKSYSIKAVHNIYAVHGEKSSETIAWDFGERESAGTNKALHLSGPILRTLTNGGVLIIDEIEAKLHPIMTIETIGLFLDGKSNPNNAQLIFATHDTNLLSYSTLRRDQIYFAEKNHWESTEIYSLSDFRYINNSKERPDTDKEKRYFEGRYGAIPILADFHSLNLITDGEKG